MLKKKLSGNWHKVEVWEKENCIVGYISGGILLKSFISNEEKYIPFYNFKDFAISEDTLYIIDKGGAIFFLNSIKESPSASNNSFPNKTNSYNLDKLDLIGDVRAYDLSESLIVCAYKQEGIDFFSRENMSRLYHFDFPGYSFVDDIKLYKDKLFIADVWGLRILDISVIDQPILNDSLINRGWPKDIAIQGNNVFIADVLGMKIYDKSDNFKLIGKIETNRNRVAKVEIRDNLAFLSCEALGLKIADITDISNPKIVSGLIMQSGAWDSYEYDGFLYVAGYKGGLSKICYDNIKNLKTVKRYQTGEEIIGVYADSRFVYAACSYNGVKILDYDLNVETKININYGRCWTIFTNKDLLFAACGKEGVLIFDVSNVTKPIIINKITTIEARDLVLRENILYIADGTNGVIAYDIKNILIPLKIKHIPSAAFTRGIMVDEQFIYKADGDGGVEIYER